MKIQSVQNDEPSPAFLMEFLFGILCKWKNAKLFLQERLQNLTKNHRS